MGNGTALTYPFLGFPVCFHFFTVQARKCDSSSSLFSSYLLLISLCLLLYFLQLFMVTPQNLPAQPHNWQVVLSLW